MPTVVCLYVIFQCETGTRPCVPHVYTSGQIPIDPTTGAFAEGGIKEQTRQSLTNVKTILEEIGLDMTNVVKTTVFMADMNDFADMNSVYAEFFTEPYPARSAVAVKTLPKGALVEIEVVAENL
ncbi:MAG: Rid family detoxifying hydrolase [Prevotella sp.]|nr:Rid family detoxifying hydrolase [Prevotella sp.]